jgi:hypothetical protein
VLRTSARAHLSPSRQDPGDQYKLGLTPERSTPPPSQGEVGT